MAFNHGRFLLPEPKLDDKKHEDDDNGKKNDSDCHFIHCNQQYSSPSPPSPPHNFPPYLILTVCSIAVAVVLLLFLAYCTVRRCRSRRTPTSPPPSDGILIDDDEEEELRQQRGHVGVVDHHVWHIRTIGLSEVAIDSIAAFKYKKRDGLIEGTTDCSVCLNEFLEDERLRLLPKCSHAFHVACIDTWLRCHTNCPVCRAPVVAGDGNGGPEGSLAGTGSSSAGPREENRAESEIRTGETEGFNVSIVCNRSTRNEKFRVVSDLGDRVNVDQDQKSRGQVRRAVSMDFSRF